MTDPRFCAYCRQRGHLPFGMPCSVCHDTSGFDPEVSTVNPMLVKLAVLITLIFFAAVCMGGGAW